MQASKLGFISSSLTWFCQEVSLNTACVQLPLGTEENWEMGVTPLLILF